MKSRLLPFLLLLGIVPSAATVRSAGAQGNAVPAGRVPVLVALVSSPAASTMIRQGLEESSAYAIVLSEATATPRNLAVAAMAVAARMDALGDDRRDAALLKVNEDASAPAREIAAASHVLTTLRSAERREVRGLGSARTTYIYLPSKASRDKLRAAGKAKFGRHRAP